jgi:hypothetical protein
VAAQPVASIVVLSSIELVSKDEVTGGWKEAYSEELRPVLLGQSEYDG